MNPQWLYLCLLTLSVVFFVIGVCCTARLLRTRKDASLNRILLNFSLFLVLAVWCVRYAVGMYITAQTPPGEARLTGLEQVADSLLHALQTFSMDEDYTTYILTGKAMMDSIFGHGTLWAAAYGIYASVLNFLSPIAGGAILFDILTGIFPRLKLLLRGRKRQTYVFSELNDEALALAESIYQKAQESGPKVTLIFTDAYASRDEESGAERLAAATNLGAICLREDLLELRSLRGASTSYILIDREESQNFHTLSVLTSDRYAKSTMLKDAKIYLFSQNELAGALVKGTVDILKTKMPEERLPMIRVVRSYTNLIYNLLDQVPLYEPLVGRTGQKRLRLTILGSGCIGTEMFLAATWCSQMLDCMPEIHVISQESETAFRDRIDAISPEILQAAEEKSPILRVYPNREIYADTYFRFRYTQADVTGQSLHRLMTGGEPGQRPVESDYFVVALGSDETNLAVATALSRMVGQNGLATGENRRTVIAYVIYDKSLGEMMNDQTRQGNLLHYAFGSLESTYCRENVFMTGMENAAYTVSQSYSRKDMISFLKDEYGWRANIARAIHQKYKRFSAGVRESGRFDHNLNPGAQTDSTRLTPWGETAAADSRARATEDYVTRLTQEGNERLIDRLTWLEHRRWCAFIRTQGFSCPTPEQLDAYAFRNGNSHKNVPLKLHPCLVECDDRGIREIPWEEETLPDGPYDCLDALAHRRYHLSGKQEDMKDCFKVWDRPCARDEYGKLRIN